MIMTDDIRPLRFSKLRRSFTRQIHHGERSDIRLTRQN
ncbi:Uncharacterized protein dnm_058050 [Desulfonema magnum]|uniref:Uncharacterized protein n=1 Tax=Desulfonema magnum TaxID=45655 RepID=A0A975BQX3_9BACT|nr:Uncharacterized protein dnm_058050 [Desulfonema magnum]